MTKRIFNGFSLIEMLVVLVLMAMLAGPVGPRLFQKVGSSKIKIALTQIELLTSALDTYRLDVGKYPSTEQGLAALRKKPDGVKNWDGAYLSKDVPLDPWQVAYQHRRWSPAFRWHRSRSFPSCRRRS